MLEARQSFYTFLLEIELEMRTLFRQNDPSIQVHSKPFHISHEARNHIKLSAFVGMDVTTSFPNET